MRCMRGWPEPRDAIASQMFHTGIIQVSDEGFRLKLHDKHPEAPLSPIYIDLRRLRSHPNLMYDIAEALCIDLGLNNPSPPHRPIANPKLLVDIPHSISPVVALMAFISQRPMITVREQAKGHGLGGLIVGQFDPGQVALPVDDVITKADSKLAAIEVLRGAGLIVEECAVVVDREQGGAQQLVGVEVELRRLYTIVGLLDFYLNEGLIDQSLVDRYREFVAATANLV